MMDIGDQFSSPKAYLSYAAPTIDFITGCQSPSNKNLLQTMDCDRTGGQRITIYGSNFGRFGANILIGSDICDDVTHGDDIIDGNNVVACVLPHGNRIDRPVIVIQRKGEISTTVALVSYKQCEAGQYEYGYECFPCDRGTYTNSISQTQCLPCIPGFYAPEPSMESCLTCEAGKHSSTGLSGAISCTNCSTGSYSNVAGQAACQLCDSGTYAPMNGMSICIKCLAGKCHLQST
jgi:hypothetical protein